MLVSLVFILGAYVRFSNLDARFFLLCQHTGPLFLAARLIKKAQHWQKVDNLMPWKRLTLRLRSWLQISHYLAANDATRDAFCPETMPMLSFFYSRAARSLFLPAEVTRRKRLYRNTLHSAAPRSQITFVPRSRGNYNITQNIRKLFANKTELVQRGAKSSQKAYFTLWF